MLCNRTFILKKVLNHYTFILKKMYQSNLFVTFELIVNPKTEFMERDKMQNLITWKSNANRKPLIPLYAISSLTSIS